MSASHIKKIKTVLENSKWILHTDVATNECKRIWKISRPNGDRLIQLCFTLYGNGNYGACTGTETINHAIGCSIVEHPEIDIYFGKYSGEFQKNLVQFMSQLNQLQN